MEAHQPRKPDKKQCASERIILKLVSHSVQGITVKIQDQKPKQDIGLVESGK